MKINDVYCNDKYSIVKTRPLYTVLNRLVLFNVLDVETTPPSYYS